MGRRTSPRKVVGVASPRSRAHHVPLVLVVAASLCTSVAGHAALINPPSRNVLGYQAIMRSCLGPKCPAPEPAPSFLHVDGLCGRTGSFFNRYVGKRNYDKSNIRDGSEPPIVETYIAGQEYDFEYVMPLAHGGHFQINICTDWENPSQDCFDEHPLEFVGDPLYGMPVDPDFPLRGYQAPIPMATTANNVNIYDLPPQWEVIESNAVKTQKNSQQHYPGRLRFRIPEDIGDCEHCLLQWRYFLSSNPKCKIPGYKENTLFGGPQVDEYTNHLGERVRPTWNEDSALSKEECPPLGKDPLLKEMQLANGVSEQDYRAPGSPDDYAPETFWNCADIAIVAASSGEANAEGTVGQSRFQNLPPIGPKCGPTGWYGDQGQTRQCRGIGRESGYQDYGPTDGLHIPSTTNMQGLPYFQLPVREQNPYAWDNENAEYYISPGDEYKNRRAPNGIPVNPDVTDPDTSNPWQSNLDGQKGGGSPLSGCTLDNSGEYCVPQRRDGNEYTQGVSREEMNSRKSYGGQQAAAARAAAVEGGEGAEKGVPHVRGARNNVTMAELVRDPWNSEGPAEILAHNFGFDEANMTGGHVEMVRPATYPAIFDSTVFADNAELKESYYVARIVEDK